jgi:hypothetical protein
MEMVERRETYKGALETAESAVRAKYGAVPPGELR